MQAAIVAPATSAPAEAPIRVDEMGWVEPSTAPNSPATTASASEERRNNVSIPRGQLQAVL